MYKDTLKYLSREKIVTIRAESLRWITRDIEKTIDQRYKVLLRWQSENENLLLREDYKKLGN